MMILYQKDIFGNDVPVAMWDDVQRKASPLKELALSDSCTSATPDSDCQIDYEVLRQSLIDTCDQLFREAMQPGMRVAFWEILTRLNECEPSPQSIRYVFNDRMFPRLEAGMNSVAWSDYNRAYQTMTREAFLVLCEVSND
jgi:hypothetical protein